MRGLTPPSILNLNGKKISINLLEKWEAWRKKHKQLHIFIAAGQELTQALNAGNYTLAAQLRAKLNILPCPTCGRNGSYELASKE